MPVLANTPTHTSKTSSSPPEQSGSATGGGAGQSGYHAQVQRLTPRESLPGLTIAGVTLGAQATGVTFQALEKALGDGWARSARTAAAKGAEAVLLQEGFGRQLDSLVPQSEGASLHVKGKVAVSDEVVACGVEVEVELECVRTREGFEISGEVGFEVGIGKTHNKFVFNSHMSGSGKGSDAVVAMNLIGLIGERTMRRSDPPKDPLVEVAMGPAFLLFKGTIGDWVANALWGKEYANHMVAGMGADDEATLEAGLGVAYGGGEKDAEIEVGLDYSGSETWNKGVGADGRVPTDGDDCGQARESVVRGQRVQGRPLIFDHTRLPSGCPDLAGVLP